MQGATCPQSSPLLWGSPQVRALIQVTNLKNHCGLLFPLLTSQASSQTTSIRTHYEDHVQQPACTHHLCLSKMTNPGGQSSEMNRSLFTIFNKENRNTALIRMLVLITPLSFAHRGRWCVVKGYGCWELCCWSLWQCLAHWLWKRMGRARHQKWGEMAPSGRNRRAVLRSQSEWFLFNMFNWQRKQTLPKV